MDCLNASRIVVELGLYSNWNLLTIFTQSWPQFSQNHEQKPQRTRHTILTKSWARFFNGLMLKNPILSLDRMLSRILWYYLTNNFELNSGVIQNSSHRILGRIITKSWTSLSQNPEQDVQQQFKKTPSTNWLLLEFTKMFELLEY